jgi:hypothetical protein
MAAKDSAPGSAKSRAAPGIQLSVAVSPKSPRDA